MTSMIDHTGRIETGEKTIADRDAEIDILQRKAQGTLRVMDKLAVTVEDLQAELADMRMKHGASRKQVGDLEAKLLESGTNMLKMFDTKREHQSCMAIRGAEMATLRKQLAEADQRHALLSGEWWIERDERRWRMKEMG
jgi:chromosome segregation ATPase